MDETLEVLKSNNSIYRCVKLSCCAYKIDFNIICSGVDILSSINIPLMHELIKLEIKHVDSSLDDSKDSLDYKLEKTTPNNLKMELFRILKCKQSDVYDEFSRFMHERCQYLLTTNTTNTDKLYISFTINFTGVN